MKLQKIRNLTGYTIIAILSAATIIPIIGVLIHIAWKGVPGISWSFLTQSTAENGLYDAIYGTMILTTLTIGIAVPFGVLSAVYMSEYAKRDRLFKAVEIAIINLAGVPSIVYGLFGMGIFVILLNLGQSILAGALTMGCLILPLIITVSYQSLQAVPNSIREASLALGASKLQTVVKVVIPSAMPGILTGVILATARVAGETAPVLFTAAEMYLSTLPSSLLDSSQLLSTHLYYYSTQVPGLSEEYKYGSTLVLITLVLMLNAIAIILRNRIKRSTGGLS